MTNDPPENSLEKKTVTEISQHIKDYYRGNHPIKTLEVIGTVLRRDGHLTENNDLPDEKIDKDYKILIFVAVGILMFISVMSVTQQLMRMHPDIPKFNPYEMHKVEGCCIYKK